MNTPLCGESSGTIMWHTICTVSPGHRGWEGVNVMLLARGVKILRNGLYVEYHLQTDSRGFQIYTFHNRNIILQLSILKLL